jgi:hypothetical protein
MYRGAQRGAAIATVREEDEDEYVSEDEAPTGEEGDDGGDDGGELDALDDEGLSYSSGTGSDYTDE